MRALSSSVLALSLCLSCVSFATIKVTGVSGASGTDNIGAATTTTGGTTTTAIPVIFGGVTGIATTATCGAGLLCNTCTGTAINTSPKPCNLTAITPSTVLTISFTSAKTGYPTITDDQKTTVIKTNGASISTGNTATITLTWQELCQKMTDNDSTCIPSNTSKVAATTFYVGISKDATGTLTKPDDEAGQISVVVSDVMSVAGNDLAPATCAAGSTSSPCDYTIQSGDEKGHLTNLGKVGGFPNLTGIKIAAMRIFAVPCTFDGSQPTGVPAGSFDTISPDVPLQVDVKVSTDSAGNAQLADSDLTGLINDNAYCTKMGAVDQAGNVGLFTPGDGGVVGNGDTFCTQTFLTSGGATLPNSCHVIRPGEVEGVMSQNCFIATAAYGTQWSFKVQAFRDFRNHFLLKSAIGKKFVKWYYTHSPYYAHKIAKSETARAITRGALTPIWLFARLSLKIGLLATTLLTFALFCSPFFIFANRRRKNKAAQGVRL